MLPLLPAEAVPRSLCVAQDGRLPLHYAAEKGARWKVMKLLLGAESNAAATAAVADKVRRSASI